MCVCVCVCACACVRACVRASERACVCMYVSLSRVCNHAETKRPVTTSRIYLTTWPAFAFV